MVDFAFLDSGTGGIPYLLELKKKCPEVSCVYVGDTANFPYGQKSHDEIVECISKVVAEVIEKFAPAVIVIACNTISVNALETLRLRFSNTNFVGTVPAIKLAAKLSKNRKIGLLATKATCENPYNLDLKNKFASDCELVMRPDPDLIAFIERKSFTATREERIAACSEMAEFFKSAGCDAVILGCTHFLNIKEEIALACGSGITVVDSCDGVVNHAIEVHGGLRGDFRMNSPLGEGVAEDCGAGCSEGKAFPSQLSTKDSVLTSLYITGSDKKDENEYNVLCSRFGLEFKGVLK